MYINVLNVSRKRMNDSKDTFNSYNMLVNNCYGLMIRVNETQIGTNTYYNNVRVNEGNSSILFNNCKLNNGQPQGFTIANYK